jgi:hypothetical protein
VASVHLLVHPGAGYPLGHIHPRQQIIHFVHHQHRYVKIRPGSQATGVEFAIRAETGADFADPSIPGPPP